MNDFSLEYIQKLRIHELRDFARQMGVSSPTTMKKEELIEKIQSIIGNGEEVGSLTSNSKNQEPLDFFALLTSPNSDIINDLVNKTSRMTSESDEYDVSNTLIVKKNIVKPTSPYAYPTNDFVGFNFKLSQPNIERDSSVSEMEGFVDIHPKGYGIVRFNGFVPSKSDAYITLALIRKYNLQKGDIVKGKVKFILENKPKIMFDIISVDSSKKASNYISFDECPYKKCGEEFYLEYFNKLHIYKGERLYIKNISVEDAVKLGYDIVDENGANVKLINLKALPEESFPSHQKMQIINCQFNKTEQESVEAVELTIERAKREFETGMPNVIMIYNFSELIRMYNVAVEGFYTYDKFNARAINQLSNIMYVAKYFEEKKNITLICLDKAEISDDVKTLADSEFMPLFNKVYNMKEIKIQD